MPLTDGTPPVAMSRSNSCRVPAKILSAARDRAKCLLESLVFLTVCRCGCAGEFEEVAVE